MGLTIRLTIYMVLTEQRIHLTVLHISMSGMTKNIYLVHNLLLEILTYSTVKHVYWPNYSDNYTAVVNWSKQANN